MGRYLLLDRDADPERYMSVLDEGCKTLAKSAWTGKQIDNAESGRQIRLLTKYIQSVYTGFQVKDQGARDRYRKQTDSFPDDGRDQGEGHEA